MPRLAGTYSSEMSSEMGTGATHQERVQKLGWFAMYLDDGQVVVRALSADGLPTVVSKSLRSREFFADYTPDYGHYTETILPLLESAKTKLVDEDSGEEALEPDEKKVFKALLLDEVPRADRKQAALEMLTHLPSFEDVAAEHKSKLNTESIASRKDGNFDEAIDLYGAMLRVTPGDDHIFFNVARVYFEKKDYVACRKYLALALEHDPGFEEASRFLRYLDKQVPSDQPEGRTYLRYRFLQPQPCVLNIGGREVEAFVVDVSEAGMQLRLAPESKAQLTSGLDMEITGRSGVVAPILGGVHGQVVWHTTTTCGVAFSTSLDSTTDDFRRIIAYARLA